MNSLNKSNQEFWLTRAQYETRKSAGQLVPGSIYHITDDRFQSEITEQNKLDYSLISNAPAIPTKTSDITNDSGFIDKNVNNLTNYTKASSLSTVATSGSYADLSNKPVLNTNNTSAQTAQTAETVSGTINLHKVSKTGNYNDLSNKPNIPTKTSDITNNSGFITLNDVPKEFYLCTYGTTTYNDITTALNNGLLPICKYNGITFIYLGIVSSIHYFGANSDRRVYRVSVNTSNTWEYNHDDFEFSYYKTQSLTSASTSSQYPSAKATYDAIQDVRESFEGKAKNYVINSQSDITGTKATDDSYTNVTAITGVTMTDLREGDNVLVKDSNSPNYWVSRIATPSAGQTVCDLSVLSSTGDYVPVTRTVNGHQLSSDVTVTKNDIGLGNVGNFKSVSTVASQGLTNTEKTNARANIGAGTSNFSGNYNDLTNKPSVEVTTNKVSLITPLATDTQYPSAKATFEAINDVREVAEGKPNNYVISLNNNPKFNSTSDSIRILASEGIRTISGESIDFSTLHLSDNFLITDENVPDRWVSEFEDLSPIPDTEGSTIVTGDPQPASPALFTDASYITSSHIPYYLRRINDTYKDVYNASTSTVTKIVGVRELLESDFSTDTPSGTLSGYTIFRNTSLWGASKFNANITAPFICSHFASNTQQAYQYPNTLTRWGNSAQGMLCISNTILGVSDSDNMTTKYNALKNWIASQRNAGTPVLVYYVMATSQSEVIPLYEEGERVGIVLYKLETAKVPITSISVNGVESEPVDGNVDISVPTKTTDLTNDSGFIISTDSSLSTTMPVIADTLHGVSNARAGQIVKISSVNSSGIPTEWETSDSVNIYRHEITLGVMAGYGNIEEGIVVISTYSSSGVPFNSTTIPAGKYSVTSSRGYDENTPIWFDDSAIQQGYPIYVEIEADRYTTYRYLHLNENDTTIHDMSSFRCAIINSETSESQYSFSIIKSDNVSLR